MKITPIIKPNFFILGAAKCGTTNLHNTLINHPEIFLPPTKELSFLSSDQDKHINNTAKYFEIFDAANGAKAIGEASPNYIVDPMTPRIMKGLFPNAKFIITLRNPADKAHSMYMQLKKTGWEHHTTFEKALAAEEQRFNSKKFKSKNQYFYHFLYYRGSLFGEQVQRYLELFPREQFYIMTLNDLKNDFDGTIKSILEFLNVDSSIYLKIGDKNTGYDIRFPQLQILQRKLPRVYRKYLNPLTNLNKTKRKPMNPNTRAMLMEHFASDVKLLEDLTGIDLS